MSTSSGRELPANELRVDGSRYLEVRAMPGHPTTARRRSDGRPVRPVADAPGCARIAGMLRGLINGYEQAVWPEPGC